ncbi:hydroxypyruvate isomerase family protein [Sphingomonas sanguinis]|jgi:hydroxypyruvate isomerase|uniref:TIM barrel protein n=1 Tax=Sphingomonas sanguinis TaxID=33051 RepID=A0A7Y7QUB5_9SPHN|nr:TIM barrel protein [Sphingomonas sanguinis]MBZ6381304.1 TIM barrel protein [Sphingomonas sanguinis]NNG50420.1 TIM barrel protein [Sphingomonas sanguinis]NNG53109.1 TIM barrel protein [Sphingomonas sanguinis]NVP30606.1 TIM barrel protein [Sphingomonas sanguinis]
MIDRRHLLGSSLALCATSGLAATPSKAGRLKQSVSRWCYQDIPLDRLCAAAAKMGLQGIDLLQPAEYDVPRRYGLRCTMGYAADMMTIANGLNRRENHAAIEQAFRIGIPQAAKAGVPNVIAFSGNRRGLSDEEGAANMIIGLNRLKPIAEDHGVTICVELLNSKVDHADYMADHTAWGVGVCKAVNSPRVKLLYDIYHMQIMEGDLIDTIRKNIAWLGHFHTGGVPGRHNLDDTQEVNWRAVAKSIADLRFDGYLAHEFVPTGDALTALAQAVRTCTV